MYQPQKYTKGQVPEKRGGGIVLVYGMPGVGKSLFGIRSEDVTQPLVFCNFDRDASHLLVKYEGEEYYYESFRAGVGKTAAEGELEKVTALKNMALQMGKGVFVIDNLAALWDIVKQAKLPEKNTGDPLPKEFGDANSYIRELMLSLESSGFWVVITAPAQQMWFGAKTDSKDGAQYFGPDGWKHLEYHLTASLWLFTDTKPVGARKVPVNELFQYQYRGQIVYAKKRPAVEGSVLDDPTLGLLLKVIKEV